LLAKAANKKTNYEYKLNKSEVVVFILYKSIKIIS